MAQGVVQTFTAAGKSILRSVNLLREETPAGVAWRSKASAKLEKSLTENPIDRERPQETSEAMSIDTDKGVLIS